MEAIGLVAVGALLVIGLPLVLGWVAVKSDKDDKHQTARWKQEVEKATRELGVTVDDVCYNPPRMRVDIQGVTVVVSESGAADEVGRCLVEASAPGKVPTELAIEHRPTYIGRTPRLYDGVLDVAFDIEGPDELVLALMSKEARNVLASLKERVSVRRGVVSITAKAWDADALVEAVRTAVGFAHLLSIDRAGLPRALAANAAADPISEFRRRCLQVLLQQEAKQQDSKSREIVRRAIAAGLKDPYAEVRLEAAPHAGAEGLAVLTALVGDDSMPAALRTTALRRLVETFPYPKVASCLAQALTDRDEGLLEVAVTAAGTSRDQSTLKRICELSRTQAPRLAEAVAAALGRLGDARAEPALLTLLEHTSPEAGLAAARSLGEMGTIQAIASLLSLTEGSRAPGTLRAAARDAIRKIQSRMGDAGAGRLSVVGWDAAQAGLSLVEEDGRVSLAEQRSNGVSGAEGGTKAPPQAKG